MLDLLPSGRPPATALDTASPALLQRRALATVFDVFFCYFTIEAVFIATIIGLAPDWSALRTSLVVVFSLIFLIPLYLTYCFFFEWRFGQTPGKVWQNIVVVTTNGEPLGPFASATRNLLRYVDWFPACFLLGWLLARRSSMGQRLGDRIADTVIVRPKPPESLTVVRSNPSESEA
jgi:uncharacterized RDD family membrane protein YckC